MDTSLEMNFCRRCGKPLSSIGTGAWECPDKHNTYNNPAPTVGIFFLTPDNQAVLSRRGINPGKGMLDCLGGFVETGETIEEAAHREITEETGLTKNMYGTLQYLCTAPATYDFQGEKRPILSTFLWATLPSNSQLAASDDVAEIVTLPLGDVAIDEFFNEDIKYGFRKLLTVTKEVM